MKRAYRIVLITLLVLALILLGVFREFVFVNINYQLKFLYYEQARSFAHSFFDFLNAYSYEQLYNSKWWLTLIFSVIYAINTLLLVYIIYPAKKYLYWTIATYGLLVVISGLIFLIGWLADDLDNMYYITRKIMGIVQSPIVAMFLIPAFRLLPETEKPLS